jgi:putative nucleotidyltransferase with HDIG domain
MRISARSRSGPDKTNIGQGFAMNKTLRILYLEDDRNDVELVRAVLGNSGLVFELEHVEGRESYLRALEKGYHDAIIIDFKLPAFDGLSALKIAKEKCMDVPAIILSGSLSDAQAFAIINEGATDYVLKDRLIRLPFSIRRAVHEQVEMIELREAKEALRTSEERFRSLVENIGIGVTLISPKMEVLFVNKKMRQWFPDVDDEQKPVYYRVFSKPPGEGVCPDCPTYKTLRDGKVHELVTEITAGDRTINFLIISSPVLDQMGKTTAAIEMVEDITEMKRREKRLTQSRDAFLNMLKEADSSYKELKELYESLVKSFANTIDAKSPWTKGHSSRVAKYAVEIARTMKLTSKEIESLQIAGLLHDIGKIGTYDNILDKPDRLTREEFEMIRKHPAHGESILRPIKQLEHILPLIRHHHERIDGKGYPDGLKGEEIPLGARILHVADSFDSMTADRPYRPAPGIEYAISELEKFSDIQFDAKVAKTFLHILHTVV